MKIGLAWALGLALAWNIPALAAKDTVQLQSPLESAGVAHQETTLGDLVADAERQTGNADIALVAADDISETSFPAGSIAPKSIVAALRYAQDPTDTIVVLTLTGAQVRKVVERSVSRSPQPFDGFLQISGLKVRFDASQPEGKRVTRVEAGGGDIQDAQTYRVATTRPVAHGSFGYFRFWSSTDITQDTQTSLASSLTDYLTSHKIIHATLENRIVAQ